MIKDKNRCYIQHSVNVLQINKLIIVIVSSPLEEFIEEIHMDFTVVVVNILHFVFIYSLAWCWLHSYHQGEVDIVAKRIQDSKWSQAIISKVIAVIVVVIREFEANYVYVFITVATIQAIIQFPSRVHSRVSIVEWHKD